MRPFSSPNLLQTTSAAYLTIAALPATAIPASLILVPSPHIRPLPPSSLKPTDYDALTGADSTIEWPLDRLRSATSALFDAVGELGDQIGWQAPDGKVRRVHAPRRGDIGDGGMYI